MKLKYTFLLYLGLIISPLFSQGRSIEQLEMPTDYTDIQILVDEVMGADNIISRETIQAHVKLQLRRNQIKYIKDDIVSIDHGTLYILLRLEELKNGDVYGHITTQFHKSNMYQITISDMFEKDFDIRTYTRKKGRGFHGVSVWTKTGLFYAPADLNPSSLIKGYISQTVDIFSSDYIDANNL